MTIVGFILKQIKDDDTANVSAETPPTTNANVLKVLLEANTQLNVNELTEIGTAIGKLYTDKGLPPDMALDRLRGYTNMQKVSVIDGLCQWLIEHKRNSGATDKAIDRQRKTNQEMLGRFIDTGELGVY